MILWLASYPKSGNTWLRLLLTNYLFDNKKDVFQNLDFFTRFPRTSQFKDICKIKEKSLDIYKYFKYTCHMTIKKYYTIFHMYKYIYP